MSTRLARVTFLVKDYDIAIAWFTIRLNFNLVENTSLTPDASKRWVRMAPHGSAGGAELLLARAVGQAQEAAVGNQGGGRVMFFLQTDDFNAEYARMREDGVQFKESEPRYESYGTVIVFYDLYGNLWDLIQPTKD